MQQTPQTTAEVVRGKDVVAAEVVVAVVAVAAEEVVAERAITRQHTIRKKNGTSCRLKSEIRFGRSETARASKEEPSAP